MAKFFAHCNASVCLTILTQSLHFGFTPWGVFTAAWRKPFNAGWRQWAQRSHECFYEYDEYDEYSESDCDTLSFPFSWGGVTVAHEAAMRGHIGSIQLLKEASCSKFKWIGWQQSKAAMPLHATSPTATGHDRLEKHRFGSVSTTRRSGEFFSLLPWRLPIQTDPEFSHIKSVRRSRLAGWSFSLWAV